MTVRIYLCLLQHIYEGELRKNSSFFPMRWRIFISWKQKRKDISWTLFCNVKQILRNIITSAVHTLLPKLRCSGRNNFWPVRKQANLTDGPTLCTCYGNGRVGEADDVIRCHTSDSPLVFCLSIWLTKIFATTVVSCVCHVRTVRLVNGNTSSPLSWFHLTKSDDFSYASLASGKDGSQMEPNLGCMVGGAREWNQGGKSCSRPRATVRRRIGALTENFLHV
jgi:hypothetical protein